LLPISPKMKFPSIHYLLDEAGKAITRFYLPLLFSFIITFVAITTTWHEWQNPHPILMKMLHTSLLGLSFSLGCTLFFEQAKKQISHPLRFVCIAAIMVAYYCFLAPDKPFDGVKTSLLFFVLLIAAHLWVSFAAFTGKQYNRIAFWQFNQVLYSRMVLGLLFSAALYAGLALAMAACKILLKSDIPDRMFLDLFFVIAGVFNTWFYVAGIPANIEELNKQRPFPKGLKIFTQYILIPISVLYIAILYAYGLKIVSPPMHLPKGWVSMLIMWNSVVGILAILLSNPLKDTDGNSWVKWFSRLFFISNLPLLVLLFVAIGTRVNEYGITELRYYLIVLGIWLTAISFYFILSKQKNIKVIPVSLVCIALLTLLGPWSFYSMSYRYQLHHLESILIKNKIWDSKTPIRTSTVNVNYKDENEIKNTIDYFVERNEVSYLQPIYATNLDSLVSWANNNTGYAESRDYHTNWELKRKLTDTLTYTLFPSHFNHGVYTAPPPAYLNLFHYSKYNSGFNLAGYSKLFEFQINFNYNHPIIYLSDKDSLELKMSQAYPPQLIFYRAQKVVETIDISPLIATLRHKVKDDDPLPQDKLVFKGTSALNISVAIKNIRISVPNDSNAHERTNVYELEGFVLMK